MGLVQDQETVSMRGMSNDTGRSLRAGNIRSMQSRRAVVSPSLLGTDFFGSGAAGVENSLYAPRGPDTWQKTIVPKLPPPPV